MEFHHPDRLGTKLVTNNQANTSFEQSTLPFGTALDAETTGTTNQRFTSYDRSNVASLDYAVNRSYSSGTGRFTSVDPIGMASTSIGNPQSMNLYAYVQNNPIDFVDPTGLLQAAPGQGCSGTLYTLWYGSNENGWEKISQWFVPNGDCGSGGDGGGASSGSGSNSQNQQSRPSEDCVNLLKDVGVWDKVEKLYKNPPFFDVDLLESITGLFGGIPGGDFFFGGVAELGETVGKTFDRLQPAKGGAYTINTNMTNVIYNGNGGVAGIYYRGSQSTILKEPNFLLHEIVHLVIPEIYKGTKNYFDGDEILINILKIKTKKNENFSQAVSRFLIMVVKVRIQNTMMGINS